MTSEQKRKESERGSYRRMFAFLLVGILLTYAISWSIALNSAWSGPHRSLGWSRFMYLPFRSSLQIWWQDAPQDFARPPRLYVVRRSRYCLAQVVAAPVDEAKSRTPLNVLNTIEVGWPWRALRGERWRRGIAFQATDSGYNALFRGIMLPVLPIWSGFWRNVLFFTVVPWLAIEFGTLARKAAANVRRREVRACERIAPW